MSPCGLVSAGIAIVRTAGSAFGAGSLLSSGFGDESAMPTYNVDFVCQSATFAACGDKSFSNSYPAGNSAGTPNFLISLLETTRRLVLSSRRAKCAIAAFDRQSRVRTR